MADLVDREIVREPARASGQAQGVARASDGRVLLDTRGCEGTVWLDGVEIDDEGRTARLRYGDAVWRLTPIDPPGYLDDDV